MTASWAASPGANGYVANVNGVVQAAQTATSLTIPAVSVLGLTQTIDATGADTVSWTADANGGSYVYSVDGGTPVALPNTTISIVLPTAPVTGIAVSVVPLTSSNSVSVIATVPSASSSKSSSAVAAPVGFTATPGATGSGAVAVTWANNPSNVNNVTGLTLSWTQTVGTPKTGTLNFAPTSRGVTVDKLAPSTVAIPNSVTFNITATGSALSLIHI